MDDMKPPRSQPKGYVIGTQRRIADVLAMQSELLRSEGLDPKWPGFESADHAGRGAKSEQSSRPNQIS